MRVARTPWGPRVRCPFSEETDGDDRRTSSPEQSGPEQSTADPRGIDGPRVRAWIAQQQGVDADAVGFQVLSVGRSQPHIHRDVLRRAPVGAAASRPRASTGGSAHDVQREGRTMAAMVLTPWLPVPNVLEISSMIPTCSRCRSSSRTTARGSRSTRRRTSSSSRRAGRSASRCWTWSVRCRRCTQSTSMRSDWGTCAVPAASWSASCGGGWASTRRSRPATCRSSARSRRRCRKTSRRRPPPAWSTGT